MTIKTYYIWTVLNMINYFHMMKDLAEHINYFSVFLTATIEDILVTDSYYYLIGNAFS